MKNLLFIFIIFLVSCHSKEESHFISSEIVIPESWELIYGSDDSRNIYNIKSQLSIIIYINGDCFNCIEDLNRWMVYIDKNEFSKEISFIFFTDIFDIDKFTKIVENNTSFAYSIYNDKPQLFWKLNKVPLKNKINAFLIYNGLIKEVGNPIHSLDDLKKFNSIINNLL